jgi:hypothetical protein
MKATPAAPGGARTPPDTRLPELRIVPSAALLLHEEYDPDRVARLVTSLATDNVLRNPPVVAALDGGMHVVLDGANRVTAMQQSHFPDQLVQVVDYDDPAIALDVWAHLLQEDGLVAAATDPAGRAPAGWEQMPLQAVRAGLEDGTLACAIIDARGARGLPSSQEIAGRVGLMRDTVARYKGRTPIYRVQTTDIGALDREYGGAAALVLFPRLTKSDIRAIARLSSKLPSGISRHIVPHRALRVNLDLGLLRGAESVGVKQARLEEIIRARLLEHRVRHYPESTVLYDE